MVTRFFNIVINKKRVLAVGVTLLFFASLFSFCFGSLSIKITEPTSANSGDELYGLVHESNLPWYYQPPTRFTELCDEHKAHCLVSAFRITLPHPMSEEEKENVSVAAQYLAGAVVLPGETFSFNKVIGQRTEERGFKYGPTYINGSIGSTIGGGICKVATTMYNVAVLSDLPIVERHPHSMLVSYVPPGRDATIVWGAKDFCFKNNKETPVVIWSEVYEKTLFIALYGQYDPPLVEWHCEELERNETWTIDQQNPSLPTGEMLMIEGYDGVSVRTWVDVYYPNQPMERRDLGVDYYNPMPGLVGFGTYILKQPCC